MKEEEITYKIIGCAMRVHNTLGNGFQEVIYQRCLAIEMERASLLFGREIEQTIFYEGIDVGTRRADFIVENKIVVELKAVINLEDVHLAHQFEAIHPFSDGNGRTGRILNLLYLVNKGLLSKPVLYLSKYIIANKEDYYFNLSAVTQRESWKNWILYMLDAMEKTSILTNRLINETVNQMEATLDHGRKHIKWYSKEMNEALFSRPYSRTKTVSNVMEKKSRTTISKYMDELIEAKILSPKKEGKEIYYLNDDLIRILEG